MSYVLPRLETKKDVDGAIKATEDKVLVLRFGRETDIVCMQLDEIVGGLNCDHLFMSIPQSMIEPNSLFNLLYCNIVPPPIVLVCIVVCIYIYSCPISFQYLVGIHQRYSIPIPDSIATVMFNLCMVRHYAVP